MKTFKDMRNIINEAYGAKKEGVMQPNGTDKVGSINSEVDKSTNKDLAKACWKGYTAVGTKKKNGKTVPNCVPEEVKEGKDIPKGYHKMPDGTIMKDSEHKTENVKVNPNARETETQNASDKKSKAKATYNQTVQKIKGMRMQEENKKGFLQGAEAAKTGKKYSENPHPKDSAEHLHWAKGHNQHRANKLTNESEIKDKKDNLPPHIKALMKKVSGKTMPSSKPTMKDVTPKGYGPNEEAEVDESTASKIVGNKLKNMNLQYRIPTPAERKAMFDKEQADKKAKEANKTIKKESHMLGFNDFIKESSCGTTKKANETVKHPNQKALDVDGDGEIEASDFKALRDKKKSKDVEESYEKGRGSTGAAFAIKKGHPDAENPTTRKKYPERQTPEYKAQWASKHKGTIHEDFDLEESTDHQHKIARDTVKNPNKSLLGGPSAKEAEETLRKKYGYNDHKINKLKEESKDKLPFPGAKEVKTPGLAKDPNKPAYIGKMTDPKTGKKLAKEDFDLDETTPVSFNKFKSMVEKYTAADRQDDAKAKRESDPNYAYSDHYGKTSKSDSANKPKSTVHKGTYGNSYDGDNGKQEKKPESTEKQGRGRPSGSKSGARQKGAGVHDGGIPVHNLKLPNNRR